ncbi:uncharacterized protein EAF01_008119 [Botrytis porri]|uniref:Ubiquitin-conjugating enzyme E2C-binding protein n=1 Tax=Botrytis porri TaxID=87229 RepID=A0A4Z1L302_9HELO|nr:uncharacterized protein EAF01_008119 [Botrytis porri]KAF7898906.1 hypothetical protein EAF01_008119 [Botrytis porri]TGO91096.1 hypothetical protein BPOR_0039g00100 [Botrytis porri]
MPLIKPLIYAELLSNIRQISILAFLDTPSDPSTKAELLADGTILKLNHAEQDIRLMLPSQVVSNSPLREFPLGSLELSWRLPLAGDFQRADVDTAQTIEAPWSAKDMVIGEQFFECRRCSTTIVEADRIKEWRDLPSEGWAEMMDIWHCHKPSDDADHNHENENLASTKGYGANTKFNAQPGIGFIDHSTFLVSETDCALPQGGNENKCNISCEICLATIGTSDPQNEGIRLFKWSLRMGTFEGSPLSNLSDKFLEPSMSRIISAQFLAIMNSSCVSRVNILPWKNPSDAGLVEWGGLSIWIFNPSIRYTTSYFYHRRYMRISETPGKPGILAMKVLSKSFSVAKYSSTHDESVEELELPGEVIHELRHFLELSAVRYLPPSARKFQEWNVSILDRHEATT